MRRNRHRTIQVYSVKKYLDLQKTGNVIVVNIKELDIKELYVIDVV